jgi:chemotaxis protein MotA
MYFIAGIAISLASVLFSIFHLHQTTEVYSDLVAITVVIGGTLSVAIMTMPWSYHREIRYRLREMLFGRRRNPSQLAIEAMALIRYTQIGGRKPKVTYPGIAGQLLRDGLELIELGFDAKKIQPILEERLHQGHDDSLRIANSLRSLAKYPPAFGLVGTVLSLVSVMRSVATGGSAQDTGTRMAVALVATLYGLVVSNLLISPAGESILKATQEDRKEADLALQAVMLALDDVSMLEAQEMVNSFMPARLRINIMVPTKAAA